MSSGVQTEKKIVIGIDNFFVGGAQKQLLEQFPHFLREKYKFHVITLFKKQGRGDFVSSIPEYVTLHQLSFSGFADLQGWRSLYCLLKQLQPDLIMSSLYFSNTVFRILAFIFGYPVIAREHNTYIHREFIHRLINRLLARISRKIVAVSKEVADFTSSHEHIPRDMFVVINNGIDLLEIDRKRSAIDANAVRRELSLSNSDRIALHVGRLVTQKRQDVLIRGFTDFRKKNPAWKLLIVGGGTQFDALSKIIKTLNADGYIHLIGERDNVHPYYAISQCFISTSEIEGMSNTHLEALAHGLPILSTRTGGTSSIVHEGVNGYFVDESTERAVVDVLERFEQSDMVKMGERSKEISKAFDIRNTVRQYEALIDAYAVKVSN